MEAYLNHETEYGWYLCLNGDKIIGGMGVIENDFHDRTYVEQKTGTKAVIDKNGDAAPYNGEPEYSINTDKEKELGYRFSELHDWIYELLDYYIECGGCNQ